MNFRDWLLNEAANIQFGMWSKDGTFSVYANGQRYVFFTDALYHRQIQKLAKYTPGKAMALVNQMVANGAAEQISPPPATKPEPKKYTQRSLFDQSIE